MIRSRLDDLGVPRPDLRNHQMVNSLVVWLPMDWVIKESKAHIPIGYKRLWMVDDAFKRFAGNNCPLSFHVFNRY